MQYGPRECHQVQHHRPLGKGFHFHRIKRDSRTLQGVGHDKKLGALTRQDCDPGFGRLPQPASHQRRDLPRLVPVS